MPAVPFLALAVVSALTAPYGPGHALRSPDGAWALFGLYQEAQLWLEDARKHDRRMVLEATVQTMTLAWSPDSAAFLVNDRDSSDREFAYIYDRATLARVDLGSRILAADPQSQPFAGPNTADHAYFHALRWIDARRVEVQLHGHTPGVAERGTIRPGQCFDLRYRIDRDGAVEKLSQRVFALDNREGCASIE